MDDAKKIIDSILAPATNNPPVNTGMANPTATAQPMQPVQINTTSVGAPAQVQTEPSPVAAAPQKKGFSLFGSRTMSIDIGKQKEEERLKKEAAKREEEARRTYEKGLASIRDLIAPSSVQITPNYIVINDLFIRTLFIFNYPRYIFPNWLSPLINIDQTMDIGMFIYPRDTKGVLDTLRKRSGQVQAALQNEAEKGLVRNPELEGAYQDIEELRDRLTRGEEKLFQFAIYITIYSKTLDELDMLSSRIESQLGGSLIYSKRAGFQMSEGFRSTIPLGSDLLDVARNMNTGALSTAFPFASMDLTSNEGIMYGINRHNNSLIIFDRFSLENANAVVFAKSGGGKSYSVKLEALRYMMTGAEIIIIDPENEYKNLCKVVGGSFLNMSLSSDDRINPFDLTKLPDNATEAEAEDNIRNALITLKGLFNLLLGSMNPEEDAIVEKALADVYTSKGISKDPQSQKNPPPLMSDFHEVLKKIPQADSIVKRLDRYVTGTFSNFFNQPTNINMNNPFVVFNIRDLEASFRPIAMYMVLDFIWSKIKHEKKKRLLIVDEAWTMMEHEDAARFIFSIAKRARKYYCGLTTIAQDVEDFLGNKYGKAIITNSSLQLLLRQSPASIEAVTKTFNLTQAEAALLLESGVGEGLFFAGLNHVAIKIIASYTEDQIVTTSPKQQIEQAAAAGTTLEQTEKT
ncbi:MAG TPA: ATP-binding protein [Patescibacteria group bacterium]|nr:ATP-binding protein [Patescibacteria group bacterium]